MGTHNSWHYLGGGGPESVAFLKRNQNSFTSSSVITLREAAIDPLIAIVFELECALDIPRPGAAGEIMKVALAWSPHLGLRDGDYDLLMIPGPGRSVSGKMLWGVNLDIQLSFNLSSKDGGGMMQNMQASNMQNIRQDAPDFDNKIRQVEAQYVRQIQQLQNELERSKTQFAQSQNAQAQLIPIKPPPTSSIGPVQNIEIRPSSGQSRQPIQSYEMRPQGQLRQNYEQKQDNKSIIDLLPVYESQVDFSYLDAIPPQPLNGPKNETSFMSMPLDMPRALSRADKARLVRSGIRGLMDSDEVPGIKPRLDIEAQDPLKAANISIQFLAYRPPPRGSRMPSRVCFGVKFYIFPHSMTDPVAVKTAEPGMPWVLEKEGANPELLLRFDVEPPQ